MFDILFDILRIVWVAIVHNLERSAYPLARICEGCGAEMANKDISGENVAPTTCCDPQTEVVLFSVAPAERLHIKGTYFINTRSTDVHAESDASGHIDRPTRIGFTNETVDVRKSSFKRAG